MDEKIIFFSNGSTPLPVWTLDLIVLTIVLVSCELAIEDHFLALWEELALHFKVSQALSCLLVSLFELEALAS